MPDAFLVVDDSKLHHQMYQLVFSRGALAGSTLHHAYDGRAGYSLLAAHPEMSLVFLDLNMPEMNGLEFLSRRKVEELHLHVPVVLVTTESTEADEARGIAAGAWRYLRKPFQPADVARVVAECRAQRASATA
ncbi:MAG: response regulator [Gemmatimonadales bacterium]|nr:response regulator [Gemmatimonadales bacterium]